MDSSIRKKILIVDDVYLNRQLLAGLLEDYYDIIEAKDGNEALLILQEKTTDISLILLDMIMPKSGGHETFLKLKAIDPQVKVLLSSGFVNESAVEDLLAQGACGFIPKPHRLPVIARAIRDVLDGKTPVLPGVCNG